MAKSKSVKTKVCLACNPEEAEKPIRNNFYASKNPMHQDGLVPWCKDCIISSSLSEAGEIDEEKFKSVLRQIDKPYYKDVVQSAINQFKKENSFVEPEDVKYHGKKLIGLYFKNINTMRQVQSKSYGDSEKEGFVRKPGVKATKLNIKESVNQSEPEKHQFEVGDFEVTDEMLELFGDGYDDIIYKKMNDKYEKLKQTYTLQTNLHQEALATYVRFKVMEEIATSKGEVDDAKKWYDAAQNAADKAKLTPKQLTKADLQKGVNSFSELTAAVEQAVDVINIMPRYRNQPHDAPDLNIYCYIAYARKLKGLPEIEYKDIYEFYDKKTEEYIQQYGDPHGIFTESLEIAKTNRPNVEKFITLPKDYYETSDDTEDSEDVLS